MNDIRRGIKPQTYFQAIIDSLEDEWMVVDKKYCIIETNETFAAHHNQKQQKIIGKHCDDIITHGPLEHGSHPHSECAIKVALQTRKPSRVTHKHIYTADGQEKEKYLDILASPIVNEYGEVTAVAELMRDVTETKNLENKISEANQHLLALNNIATVVSQSLSLETVLDSSLDKTLEIMNKKIGGILLLNQEKQELKYAAYRGLSAKYAQQMHFGLGDGIAGRVAQTGEAIICEDILADSRAILPDLIALEGLRAFASIPLIFKSKVLGVLNIASLEPCQFSSGDIQLLNSIAAQIGMAVENAKLHQEVQRQDRIRGELLHEIISIQEEERRRIARELHDDTSQSLASVIANLAVVANLLPTDIEKAKLRLEKAEAMSADALAGVHRLIYELRPSLLDDLGLVAVIRWLAENSAKKAGISIRVKKVGREKRLATQVETTIFRVVQEAISNIIKHAECKHAEINLVYQPRVMEINIEDDGKGFAVDEAIDSKERPRGLGLIGMRERVELLKGILKISSDADCGGTKLSIQIPVNPRRK